MKVIACLLFIVFQLPGIFSTSVPNNPANCGPLGIMSTENLPKGISPEDVRTCAAHPLGRKRDGPQSWAPMSHADLAVAATNSNPASRMVQPDACNYGAPYGCSRGSCWRACGGSGEWCWLASNGGYGNWASCASYNDCNLGSNYNCGQNCPVSSSCGCGC